ncbi:MULTISPECIES: TetR/AcrR family transcriptional regulator [Pseudofrankia]|uniref:TetR/AcrR family transcriptional regulator n=1 Tax=Pseudofrankia TaxID=2994363 RepID=UPI0002E22426|nr:MULTISPECIES: TetR/AcrR family transcriptional regulator [Pseudofrankia]OHV35621.1 hypothetical protein BCD49_21730 [Pseudofrankia sp. EUN1h]
MSAKGQSRNPRGEGERLREALLAAAAGLLTEDPDLQHLSVRAVTSRAGVTHTAMYLHFADKQALIEAVKVRCFDDLAEVLADAVREAPDDPAARLRKVGEAYLRFATARPGHYAVMFHAGHPAQVTPAPEHVRAAGLRAFDSLVALTADVTGGRDARDAAAALWLSLHGWASIRQSMPWFPLPDELSYVASQVHALARGTQVPGA